MNYQATISTLEKKLYFLGQEITALIKNGNEANEVDRQLLQYKKQKQRELKAQLSEARFDSKNHTNPFKQLQGMFK